MYSVSLPYSLEQISEALLPIFDDVAWLDNPKSSSFSLLAFDACDSISFSHNNTENEFKKFLSSLALMPENSKKDVFEPSALWIGYISYESYIFNPTLKLTTTDFKKYPLSVWKRYESYFISSQENSLFISFSKQPQKVWSKIKIILDDHFTKEKQVTGSKIKALALPHLNISQDRYFEDFERIQSHLNRGDFFEMNYTINYSSVCDLQKNDLKNIYFHLRKNVSAPMMALFLWNELSILSASPELFFKILPTGQIITQPIKGTAPRFSDTDLDEMTKKQLLKSPKDRAELLMITDLLRNDLSRICEVGTVLTPKLLYAETFSHYHHLLSEITGQIKKPCSFYEVFLSLFPGGSITGAPKIEVMKTIQNIEKRPRGVYTGGLGFIAENGFCEFNIAIRTLTYHQKLLEFSTGGGIVLESSKESEFLECQIKAKGLLNTLESMCASA